MLLTMFRGSCRALVTSVTHVASNIVATKNEMAAKTQNAGKKREQ